VAKPKEQLVPQCAGCARGDKRGIRCAVITDPEWVWNFRGCWAYTTRLDWAIKANEARKKYEEAWSGGKVGNRGRREIG
jgi:hypothetical protein